MLKRNGVAAFAMMAIALNANAQKTEIYTHELKDFQRAVELYNDQQFYSAQVLFNKVKEQAPSHEVEADCAYYIATCALRLDQNNGDVLMENFIENYPTSAKHNQAYIEVAQAHFAQKQYKEALLWFDKIDERSLSGKEKDRFNFEKGYALFAADRKNEATSYFKRVIKSPDYGSQATYYLGYMSYEDNNFEEANSFFNQVQDQKKYQDKMSYYQADMAFQSGDFLKAIELGQKAFAKSDAQEKSELNKIIGESYFNLKQYDKAIPYLKEYRGTKGKWSNTDFYILGYSYYQQKDYENAILTFNKIIVGNDAVAQNAYYHLGESYLRTDKKPQALNAFKNASEMTFEAKIQEDAFLNYAKLSYEIGNPYRSVPDVLTEFLKKYPSTSHKIEVESLLVDSYISSKNYKEALVLLEKNKASINKDAYQKVTFYRGLELYSESNYQLALEMFKKSIAEGRDRLFTNRALFWKGETEFTLTNFNDALLTYKQFINAPEVQKTSEYKDVQYHLAYAHFKLKEYDQAIIAFQNFIATKPSDPSRLNDAYLRLADSQFVTAKYWPAMESYNKAIEMKRIDADYAAFQKGISYGFVGRNDSKITDLEKFVATFPKSQYRDDALFELGNTYTIEKKNDQAIRVYDQLLKEYPQSLFASKAMLRQGLVYFNTNKPQPALQKLKKVASDYPKTAEAMEAVTIARQIYVDLGQVNEYADWVKTLDYIEVSNADLDNATYEAAEKQYIQNNTKAAISSLSNYVIKFPGGLHSLKANFYLGQLYYADGLESNAMKHYEYVIAQPRSEFTEQALVRVSEIHLKQEDRQRAIVVLKRLETEADYPQNVAFAQANLMKSYYDTQDYASAVSYADKVLSNSKADNRAKSDAQIIVARSAFKTGNEVKARSAYEQLRKIAQGELAAEALYFEAYFKNKDGKFEASNTSIQTLARDYAGFKYYGAKGLVLMAKNYYGLKDSYQATYILESVISNFGEYSDVINEAQKELNFIKEQESKRNSSIKN